MKRISLAILLLISFAHAAISQETVLVTKNNGSVFEEYSVLKSDKKIKHGNYTRLTKGTHGALTLEELGSYSNNKREGYWEFYYQNLNNIKEKGFYSKGIKDSIWVYFYSEHLLKKLEKENTEDGTFLKVKNANPVVSKSGLYRLGKPVGVWKFYNDWGQHFQTFNYDQNSLLFHEGLDVNNISAGFIGGKYNEHAYIFEYYNFDEVMESINSKMRLEPGKISFQFIIDQSGKIKNLEELENTIANKKFYTRAIETINDLSNHYYPGKEDGVAFQTIKKITFSLEVKTTKTTTMEMMSKQKNFEFNIYIDEF